MAFFVIAQFAEFSFPNRRLKPWRTWFAESLEGLLI